MIVSKRFQVETRGQCEIVNITARISQEIQRSSIKSGTATIFVTGSTAGISVMEYEPGLLQDVPLAWERLVPEDHPYQHNTADNNGHAHIRAMLLGPSLVVPFTDRCLALGTWQQVVLLDFDTRARTREIMLQLMGE